MGHPLPPECDGPYGLAQLGRRPRRPARLRDWGVLPLPPARPGQNGAGSLPLATPLSP